MATKSRRLQYALSAYVQPNISISFSEVTELINEDLNSADIKKSSEDIRPCRNEEGIVLFVFGTIKYLWDIYKTKAPFTLRSIFGTARIKLVPVFIGSNGLPI